MRLPGKTPSKDEDEEPSHKKNYLSNMISCGKTPNHFQYFWGELYGLALEWDRYTTPGENPKKKGVRDWEREREKIKRISGKLEKATFVF